MPHDIILSIGIVIEGPLKVSCGMKGVWLAMDMQLKLKENVFLSKV